MAHTPFELFISGSHNEEEVRELENRLVEALREFDGKLYSPQTQDTISWRQEQ